MRLPSPLVVPVLPSPFRSWTLTPENWTVGLPPTPEATYFIWGRMLLSVWSSLFVRPAMPAGPALPSGPGLPSGPALPAAPDLPSTPSPVSLYPFLHLPCLGVRIALPSFFGMQTLTPLAARVLLAIVKEAATSMTPARPIRCIGNPPFALRSEHSARLTAGPSSDRVDSIPASSLVEIERNAPVRRCHPRSHRADDCCRPPASGTQRGTPRCGRAPSYR